MCKFKFLLDRKSLETIYISFIRPILEYGDVVWDNNTRQEKQDIEKIQIETASIVTGTTKLVSIHSLYEETGWETLKTRRRIIILLSSLSWQMVYLLRIFQILFLQLLTTPRTTIYAIPIIFI